MGSSPPVLLSESWRARVTRRGLLIDFVVLVDLCGRHEHHIELVLNEKGVFPWSNCTDQDGARHPHIGDGFCIGRLGDINDGLRAGWGDASLTYLRRQLEKINTRDAFSLYDLIHCGLCGALSKWGGTRCRHCSMRVAECCTSELQSSFCPECYDQICPRCEARQRHIECPKCGEELCTDCFYGDQYTGEEEECTECRST